jgi:signal transduction histidine kinase
MQTQRHVAGPASSKGFFALLALLSTSHSAWAQPVQTAPAKRPITEIVYGGDANFAPYESLNARGEPEGLNVDLIRAVGRMRGIRVSVRLLPWAKVRAGLLDGAIDVAAMYRSARRARVEDFAIAHELVYHEMFVRQGTRAPGSLQDLRGKRVLLESDTIVVEALEDMGLGAELHPVPSEPEALEALARGEGDVAVVAETAGRPFLQRRALEDKIAAAGPPVLLTEYGFVTRSGRRDLIEILNQGVAAVKASGEYDHIYDRWLRPDRVVARRVAWAFAGALAIALAVVLWNQALRRRVARQTVAIGEIGSSYNALVDYQKQLDRANKELEAFSYSVSHDLRAPLRAIDGYTRILVEDHERSLDDEGKRVCGVIRENVRGMGQLIDDLLNFSRLSRAPMEPLPVDMRQLVLAEFETAVPAEVRERVRFTLGELPGAVGDPRLLRHVWMNLLSNAVKFTSKRERPEIEVSGEETAKETLYTVRDNGAGFDMRFAGKLFGVFQRLHSAREFEGTGVGLAIVQRIVERHGGRVWAEGEVDQGAVFHFALPKTGSAPRREEEPETR